MLLAMETGYFTKTFSKVFLKRMNLAVACDSRMYERALFKNGMKRPYFFLCFCALLPFFHLSYSNRHALENALQCYYYLYILHNLVAYIYMYK